MHIWLILLFFISKVIIINYKTGFYTVRFDNGGDMRIRKSRLYEKKAKKIAEDKVEKYNKENSKDNY